jgi:hypothetical protein
MRCLPAVSKFCIVAATSGVPVVIIDWRRGKHIKGELKRGKEESGKG